MAKRLPKARSTTTRPPLDGVLAFLGQAIKNNRYTGAVLPSSSMLAKAMTKSLRQRTARGGVAGGAAGAGGAGGAGGVGEARRLLEVGPGTGPFTRYMLAALRPGDELHIVEINPTFADRLEQSLLGPFRRAHPDMQVALHCHPIQSAPLTGKFDYIVCGLPFNNFAPAEVRLIFRKLLSMLKRGGELAYFEYAGVRIMKGAIVDEAGRRKLKRIHLMGKVLSRRHRGRRELVLGNMPPAVAVRLTR